MRPSVRRVNDTISFVLALPPCLPRSLPRMCSPAPPGRAPIASAGGLLSVRVLASGPSSSVAAWRGGYERDRPKALQMLGFVAGAWRNALRYTNDFAGGTDVREGCAWPSCGLVCRVLCPGACHAALAAGVVALVAVCQLLQAGYVAL